MAKPRVLLVEDEGSVALMIEDMLEELGCEVVASAARLGEAFEAAEALPLDFVVLDVNVAGEVSYDFARRLAARDIPFMFSTGYGNAGLPADLSDRPVLTKPFRLDDLGRLVAAARTQGSCI